MTEKIENTEKTEKTEKKEKTKDKWKNSKAFMSLLKILEDSLKGE
jgi:hypothetical protein